MTKCKSLLGDVLQSQALKIDYADYSLAKASPILKWVGGKSQLLSKIQQHYPQSLIDGEIDTYIEPFVGGGAVFFDIVENYSFQNCYLFDANPELVILYNSIKHEVERVISDLSVLEKKYLTHVDRQGVFYTARDEYNSGVRAAHEKVHHNPVNTKRAALTIFLNRTCFNGLFRVNSKGLFNVPHGRYKNPKILFDDKLRAASKVLKKAVIKKADFSECQQYVRGKTYIYYDPPYRPLSKTSQFTSYSKDTFGDAEQIRLAGVFRDLHSRGVYQLLSNSDPNNHAADPFFDELYHGFNISRVDAKRMINSDASKRGMLKEILVRNY